MSYSIPMFGDRLPHQFLVRISAIGAQLIHGGCPGVDVHLRAG
jgi:hypothetical protein